MLGDRVTVKCGVQLWDGLRVERRRLHRPERDVHQRPVPAQQGSARRVPRRRIVGRGASIGANATILPGLAIGRARDGRRRRGRDPRRAARTRSSPATPRASSATSTRRRGPQRARRRSRGGRPARRCRPPSAGVDAAPPAASRTTCAAPCRRGSFATQISVRAAALLRRLRRARQGSARRARPPACHQFLSACAALCGRRVDDGATSEEVVLDDADARALPAADGLGASSTSTRPTRAAGVRVGPLRRRRLHPRLRRVPRDRECRRQHLDDGRSTPSNS